MSTLLAPDWAASTASASIRPRSLIVGVSSAADGPVGSASGPFPSAGFVAGGGP